MIISDIWLVFFIFILDYEYWKVCVVGEMCSGYQNVGFF